MKKIWDIVLKIAFRFDRFFSDNELSKKLQMEGVEDLCKAPLDVFALPSITDMGREYTNKHFAGYFKALPGLQKKMAAFKKLSSGKISYLTIMVRWMEHQEDFQTKGLRVSWSDPVTMSSNPDQKKLYVNLSTGNQVSALLNGIRGPFNYDTKCEYSVIVCAIPTNKLGDYFEISNGFLCVKNNHKALDTIIPPKYIVGMVGSPSHEECEALQMVVRKYWHRLQSFGYRASKEDRSFSGSNHPFMGPLPKVLISDALACPKEIGLNNGWDALGILEAWHRLTKVVAMASKHKESQT